MEAERRRYFKKEGAINCIERCCYIGLGLRTHRGFGACHITGGLGRNSLVGRWGRMQERMRRTRVDRLLFGVKGMIFLKMRSISASLRSDGNERTEKDNFRIQGKKKKGGPIAGIMSLSRPERMDSGDNRGVWPFETKPTLSLFCPVASPRRDAESRLLSSGPL